MTCKERNVYVATELCWQSFRCVHIIKLIWQKSLLSSFGGVMRQLSNHAAAFIPFEYSESVIHSAHNMT